MSATLADVRHWASSKGMSVGQRGRLGRNVVDSYNKANPKKRYETEDKVSTDTVEKPVEDAETTEDAPEAMESIPAGAMPVKVSRTRQGNKEVVTVTFEIAS